MANNNIINRILGEDKFSLNKKTKSILDLREFNPFLNRSGELVNKYINYQNVLDNPHVTQKAKDFISQATGLTSGVPAQVAEIQQGTSYIPTGKQGAARVSATASGDFSAPLDTMSITSDFGMRTHPIDKVQKMHYGIDFAAPTGTPVKAATSGKVTYAGDKKDGYGISVYIDNGSGTVTRYSHLQSADVNTGDVVNGAQLIGKVGATGKATGPHLDFGVIVNGKYVDPKIYLK